MIRHFLVVLTLTAAAFAQGQPAPGGPPPARAPQARRNGGMMGAGFMRPMGLPGGKFWTNTALAQKIGLTDAQTKQMDKIFQDTRLKLIDQVAAVQKAQVEMEPMLQADQPNESQVLAQIDKIAQARAELEKTNARMMLGIRQVMSVDQWNQLKTALREQREQRALARSQGQFGPNRRNRRNGPGAPAPAPQPNPPANPQ